MPDPRVHYGWDRFQPECWWFVDVKDTVISDNSGGGIVVSPQAGGNAGVVLSNVTSLNGNGSGVLANVATGVVNISIVNSVANGHAVRVLLILRRRCG